MAGTKQQRELIIKALTDPKFRKLLAADPARALGVKKVSVEMAKEIKMVLAAVKGIDVQIGAMADELLCACSVTAAGPITTKKA